MRALHTATPGGHVPYAAVVRHAMRQAQAATQVHDDRAYTHKAARHDQHTWGYEDSSPVRPERAHYILALAIPHLEASVHARRHHVLSIPREAHRRDERTVPHSAMHACPRSREHGH